MLAESNLKRGQTMDKQMRKANPEVFLPPPVQKNIQKIRITHGRSKNRWLKKRRKIGKSRAADSFANKQNSKRVEIFIANWFVLRLRLAWS